MGNEKEIKQEQVRGTLVKIPFSIFAPVTVSLPLFSLIFCFVTAIIFQFDEVNKTVCQVKNMIPSISAITGVTPQRYVWRVCIGLHCTPRYAVGMLYRNYYKSRKYIVAPSHRGYYEWLISINFWTYTIENSCLVGVTYIANVENYPLHEKIFIVFMFTSLFHEFFTLMLYKWCHPHMTDLQKYSYKMKKCYFVAIMSFTAGLVYFFLRHRLWCEPNAFSWFSVCEYGIAITNIGFHYTAKMDFKGFQWIACLPASFSSNYCPDADSTTALTANNNTTTTITTTATATEACNNHISKKKQ